MSRELKLRIVFGVLLAAFSFFQTWLGGLPFQVFVGLLVTVVFWELRSMFTGRLPARVGWFTLAFIILIMAAFMAKAYDTAFVLFGFALVALGAWEMLIKRSAYGSFIAIYCVLPFIALAHLRGFETAGLHLVLIIFFAVWGADSFAYIAGKSLGGPKLAPAISPSKTWSGFFGGLIGGVALGVLVAKLAGYNVASAPFIALCIATVLASQLGDLFESWIKRIVGVKDSGSIIPGHGGVLDRVDGMIFSVVLVWIVTLFQTKILFGNWIWDPAVPLLSSLLPA